MRLVKYFPVPRTAMPQHKQQVHRQTEKSYTGSDAGLLMIMRPVVEGEGKVRERAVLNTVKTKRFGLCTMD